MQFLRNTLTTLLVSVMVLGGCAKPPSHPEAGKTTGATSEDRLPLANPAYPGPYETVLRDGVEYRQGRFPDGKFGGQLVRSTIASDPKVFNPWTSSDTASSAMAGLMFSGLVGVDPYTGDAFPDMAKEVKVLPDGMTYVTTLRKGLKWSDGKPVTAEDVAFTWNTIIAGGYGNASLRDVTTIDGKSPTVTVVDSLTNKFVTPKPFAPFQKLLGIPVAPKHVIEPIIKGKGGREAFQQLWAAGSDLSKLVTLGPFRVARFVPGQRVEFVPSKNYYMINKSGKQLPYFSKLIYQFVPDVNANLLKFKAKEIDLTQVRPRDTVQLMEEQTQGNYTLHNLGQDNGSSFFMFNLNQRKNPKTGKPYVDPIKQKWFNDLNFRQAVNHALNRENMVANYFKGLGFPLFTALTPASPFFSKSLQGFKQDLNYSNSLLQKSGFHKKPDGWLYDKDGHQVEFDMLAGAGGTFNEAVGNMIINDLKKLGMKVNFVSMEFNVMVDKVSNQRDWQACMFGLGGGDPLEPNDSANVYKTDGRLHVFDLRSADSNGTVKVTDARPWEKRIDEIFNQGAQILDKGKRRPLYDEWQQIVYDQAPFIFLVSPMTIIGTRNTLGNYQPTQLSQSAQGLHNLEEIYKK